ncbi:uncharacterized protein LOC108625193 [Ceratina calcarata]|uniref:Uncharacterized protein LOC108625193 n=1 Tax=Ceratina calcarata TaxID=156304 RepID=A0AAJ7WAZ4_9HYME|nr:uncharacterized protein LOC108625193 [Ceratina calcarata]
MVQPYLYDDFSGKIATFPTINELKLQAEQEFVNSYGLFPTCAVYAPGCLTIAGKCTDLAETHVPGFQIVIASTLPIKRGLGSKSSLVVALFTFLEAMTNTYVGNTMEKTLACVLAKKIATGTYKVRITDIATSVIGSEGKIYAVDARNLDVFEHPWIGIDVELILIELGEAEKRLLYLNDVRYKEIMTVMNTTPRWRTHPDGILRIMDLLFARETMDMVRGVIDKDRRIAEMTDAIEKEQWNKLGIESDNV